MNEKIDIDGVKVVMGDKVFLDPDAIVKMGRIRLLRTHSKDPRENGVYKIKVGVWKGCKPQG